MITPTVLLYNSPVYIGGILQRICMGLLFSGGAESSPAAFLAAKSSPPLQVGSEGRIQSCERTSDSLLLVFRVPTFIPEIFLLVAF